MQFMLPDIPESERTPAVLQVLDLCQQMQAYIARLEEEIARLKGLKARPVIRPSILESPPSQATSSPSKRPGSDKRSKNSQLTIHHEVLVPLLDPTAGAVFKG